MNIFKKIIFFIAAIASMRVIGSTGAAVNLVNVLNNSMQVVVFAYGSQVVRVNPGKKAKLLISLPFHKTNLFNFVLDLPSIPVDSCRLETAQGTFFLWCDERGIIIAREACASNLSRQEALPSVACALTSEQLSRIIGCMVTVDKAGSVTIATLREK